MYNRTPYLHLLPPASHISFCDVRTLPLPFYDISLRPFKKYCTARVAATAAASSLTRAGERKNSLCGKKERKIYIKLLSHLTFYLFTTSLLTERANSSHDCLGRSMSWNFHINAYAYPVRALKFSQKKREGKSFAIFLFHTTVASFARNKNRTLHAFIVIIITHSRALLPQMTLSLTLSLALPSSSIMLSSLLTCLAKIIVMIIFCLRRRRSVWGLFVTLACFSLTYCNCWTPLHRVAIIIYIDNVYSTCYRLETLPALAAAKAHTAKSCKFMAKENFFLFYNVNGVRMTRQSTEREREREQRRKNVEWCWKLRDTASSKYSENMQNNFSSSLSLSRSLDSSHFAFSPPLLAASINCDFTPSHTQTVSAERDRQSQSFSQPVWVFPLSLSKSEVGVKNVYLLKEKSSITLNIHVSFSLFPACACVCVFL